MLFQTIRRISTSYSSISKRALCVQKNAQKWDLYAALCLERKPVITSELNDLERKYQALVAALEFERSLKSDFEVRHEQETKNLEALKKGAIDVDLGVSNMAQDFIDASIDELNQFKKAARTTEADSKNDTTSLQRKLDKYLVFVTKQKIGDKEFFLFPQALREDGETLRQTAERILKTNCGPELKAQFYGNAPVGFYKYKYPKKIRNETNVVGAKIFFYLAKYCGGAPSITDYKWLDHDEVRTEFVPEYHASVKQFFIDL